MSDNNNMIGSIALDFAIEIPEMIEKAIRNKDYISYGEENKYPAFLWDLYNECATHQSIIDGVVTYTIGGGIETTNLKLAKFFENVDGEGNNINDISKKLLLDYQIFGGFSAQVIPSNQGVLNKLNWINFMNCRVNEDEDYIYVGNEWLKYNPKFETLPNFTPKNYKKSQLFYFKGNKTRGVYPLPLYNGAIKSLSTSIEIDNFHLNNISNGFQPSTVFAFNNGMPTPEQKQENEKNIAKKFNGTKGQKFITVYNKNKDTGMEITKLDMDNFGEQFEALTKNTDTKIFTAHKVTSPALFGVKSDNNGFTQEEFIQSFEIFNKTIIKGYQDTFLAELSKILKPYFKGDLGLSIKPFNINNENL